MHPSQRSHYSGPKQRLANQLKLTDETPLPVGIEGVSSALKSLLSLAAEHDIELDASSIEISHVTESNHIAIRIEAVERRPGPDIITYKK